MILSPKELILLTDNQNDALKHVAFGHSIILFFFYYVLHYFIDIYRCLVPMRHVIHVYISFRYFCTDIIIYYQLILYEDYDDDVIPAAFLCVYVRVCVSFVLFLCCSSSFTLGDVYVEDDNRSKALDGIIYHYHNYCGQKLTSRLELDRRCAR